MTPPTPSSNAVEATGTDRSVTVEGVEGEGPRIRIKPDPQLDPILVCTVPPRSAQTLVTALRAYRRSYSGDADEANRADRWITALERALHIYWSWIEERHRASENGEAAAVLRGREGPARGGQDASGEGDE
jgi:hypothetical protein